MDALIPLAGVLLGTLAVTRGWDIFAAWVDS